MAQLTRSFFRIYGIGTVREPRAMLNVHFFHRSDAPRFQYHFKVLLIPLLFFEYANVARGELILIDLIVLHVFNSESFIPAGWFLCDLLRNIYICVIVTFLLFWDLFLSGGLGTG